MDKSGFTNASGTFTVSLVGNDLYLNYAAVPKPSTWWLMGCGLSSLFVFLRRRSC